MVEDVGLFSASWLPMLCIEGWRITCVHRRCREVHCCHDCHCWPCCLRGGFRTSGWWWCWPMRCGGCCRSQCLPRCCGRHCPLPDGCRCSLRGCRCHCGSHCGCRCGSSSHYPLRDCGCRCHCGSRYGCRCGSSSHCDYHYYDFRGRGPSGCWACRSGVRRRSCRLYGCGHP